MTETTKHNGIQQPERIKEEREQERLIERERERGKARERESAVRQRECRETERVP